MQVDTNSLSLILYPASVLMERAKEVDPSDEEVQAVAAAMCEIMFKLNGVGLAAPQVGLSWRLFVTRDPEDEESAVVWMNPKLEITDDSIELSEEGCLSIPDVRAKIRRPVAIRISGHNEEGKLVTQESDDYIARIWQHENDHLDGVLIINKMNAMDRLVNRRRLRDLERAG